MNLHRILAENMARFGTKNLSGPGLRTILNEGYTAGGQISTLDLQNEPTATNGATPAIAQYLGKYTSTTVRAFSSQKTTLIYPAFMALCYATYNWLQTDKEALKLQRKARTVDLYDVMSALIGGSLMQDQGSEGDELQKLTLDKATELTKQITYNNTKVDVYPSTDPKYPKSVATMGNVASYQLQNAGKQTHSNYNTMMEYMNAFNLGNINQGDFTQYVLSEMLTAENFVDMQLTVSANNRIYVYTPGTKSPDKADKELTSTTVGASESVPKNYDVAFTVGKSDIAANDTEVAKAVQDAIAMFPDGNITNLTVLSSASPEFNAPPAGNGPKTLADYGQTPTTGTGDPGAGTTDIAKNIKLAYDRGVSFMTALNAGLLAQGKPAINGYTINWQISDKGGKNNDGRYTAVSWEKAGSKGTEVPGAKSTGTQGTTTGGNATFDMTQHEFTF